MSATETANMTLGEYLRRLRESRNLSQREAAKQAGISYAYLSQIEGSKRGKRKKGEEHFGPHPQFLKKLADVYHVSAGQLFERAGYLDNDKTNIFGFSEKNEIERIFDFVIRDPALKQILSVLDKRAVISRYEALTGKRLITWAGEPDKHPSANKTEFAGLRCEDGMLHADTSNTKLTVKEVAEELECSEDEVKQIIRNNQLRSEANDFNELFVEKSELQRFKINGIRNWMHTGAKVFIAKSPSTPEEQSQQHAALFGQPIDSDFAIFEDSVVTNEPHSKRKKRRK